MPLIDENAEMIMDDDPEDEKPLPFLRDEIQACIVLLEKYKKRKEDEVEAQRQLGRDYDIFGLITAFSMIGLITLPIALPLSQLFFWKSESISNSVMFERHDFFLNDLIRNPKIIQRLSNLSDKLGLPNDKKDNILLLDSLIAVKNLLLREKSRLTFLSSDFSKKLPHEINSIILHKADLMPNGEEIKLLALEKKLSSINLFSTRKRPRIDEDVPPEEMSNSAFGQGSHTAKRIKK